jgi:hypothetical protein
MPGGRARLARTGGAIGTWLSGDCLPIDASQASKPVTPREKRKPQRNPFQSSSLRFSKLSRCFHAGLLGDFEAEPERACREVGGGWCAQAERSGLERGPPSPQHSANTQRSTYALHLHLTEDHPAFGIADPMSPCHRLTTRCGLGGPRSDRNEHAGMSRAGGADRRCYWDMAERRWPGACPLATPRRRFP